MKSKPLKALKLSRIKRPDLDMAVKGFRLAFSEKTYVMGVLNVTPDSFSDGKKFFDTKKAIVRGLEMASEGADIIDVGGESTRPGAPDVSAREEMSRVAPVIWSLRKKIDIPISIDTRKASVAEEALGAGADIVNDVSGLRHDRAMAAVVARTGAALIIMHMKGTPQDMQNSPSYRDLINEIIGGLRESINIAKGAGIKEGKTIIDPGIGFGKTLGHNLEIINRLEEFKALGRPICIGISRKSFIGRILNISDTDKRLAGSIAASVIAITGGANIIRAHDVKETCEAARITDSILKSGVS